MIHHRATGGAGCVPRHPIGSNVNPSCTICASPSRGDIDSALDGGSSIRELAGRSEFSRGTITRHAQHRAQRELTALATASALLSTPDLTTPDAVSARYRELAGTAAHLAQLAASVRDPALVLRAVRAEADLLDRIAPRIPAEQAAFERQERIFTVIGTAARDSLDPEAAQRFAAAVNSQLRAAGLIRMEVPA